MPTIIHPSAKVSAHALIDESSRGTSTEVGEGCVIDAFVRIKHVGGSGNVRLGKGVYLNSGTVIYSGNGVDIGDDVLVGPNCSLVPVNHATADMTVSIRTQGFAQSRGGLTIESNVWLGANCVVLDGVVIGSGSVVAAGAVVNRSVAPNSIVGGVPARLIGMRSGNADS